MADEKKGDLVLSQGMYAFIQDGTIGNVEVVVGPFKTSLSDTDKLVSYNDSKSKFVECDSKTEAIFAWVKATEGQYIELINPAEGGAHPNAKSKQAVAKLLIGKKVNIPGPETFALYPGQLARVIDGHQLKSNEYLLVRVYNEKEAIENIAKTVVVGADDKLVDVGSVEVSDKKTDKPVEDKKKKDVFDKTNLVIGKLIVVRGTDVSFFIPPTGMEAIMGGSGSYIRKAETLEMLEYCILLDENGEKRFVNGPAVVFPKPTESFIELNGKRKFRAIELNDNMGLYIKVIADYKEGDKTYQAGEELFITGKDSKIYYPRTEHSIVTYDGQDPIHYATTVPEGEARYVLDKVSGKINLAKGPLMLLPDPRREVIIKRILDQKTVNLLFPGNQDALDHNKDLENFTLSETPETFSRGYVDTNMLKSKSVSSNDFTQDEFRRKAKYTKPRTITLDTKYDGAVTVNVWPGYAVQVISKKGDRKVELGPKIIMLEYDETLEVLELSTGKPKLDHTLLKTAYLQISNNIVSDIVEAETSDMVNIKVRISYRVNFEDADHKKWFTVSNYVKLLTQNLRSILRNSIKKVTVDEFQKNGVDLIRNTILGEQNADTKKRVGRKFDENGMRVYDVEVLGSSIDDSNIDQLLKSVQKKTIENNLKLLLLQQDEHFFLEQEKVNRKRIEEKNTTELLDIKKKLTVIDEQAKIDQKERLDKIADSEALSKISEIELNDRKNKTDLEVETKKSLSDITIEETKEKLNAIQPGLIEALITLGGVSQTEILARNLKEQKGGLSALFDNSGGINAIRETFKGTALETAFDDMVEKFNKMKSDRK
jgi:major vault protein